MLQARHAAPKAYDELQSLMPFPPAWTTMGELEEATDEWMRRWLRERSRVADHRGPFAKIADRLDQMIRTDLPEHTDNSEVSSARKLRIVRSLHRTNILLGVYRRYTEILVPLVRQLSAARGRPVRLLELASGSGEMAMQLGAMAARERLPLEVTGSDYVPEVVRDAQSRASSRGLGVHFRTVDAFDMSGALQQGQYDIFLVIGSMHHFSPGQLAVMMAQSKKLSDPGSLFVGIDGYRSIPMLFFLPLSHLVTLLPDHIHDAWLSARKFYSLYELELIARIALPGTAISATHLIPGISVLTARM